MNSQQNNPLHGVKLQQIIEDLVAHYGWEYMGYQIGTFRKQLIFEIGSTILVWIFRLLIN